MVDQEIQEQLKRIFKGRFDLEFNSDALLDEHLLGRRIGLNSRDLLYLFFDIEETFKIHISQESIVTKKFTTFNNICQMIIEQKSCYTIGI
ncbi:acyl carrier protein [Paenibacillus anaericanus]|uniref:Peptide maturation system acyl carrier-related protein n=1 Tax=Paenibacillus anaericanus TaxID=170367 RepID=A0A433Y4F1_9BACL|nr:peptide maturation system acyl carrier-related protein [Paenibacillus anaericanus]MDQ0089911.1 acyl carrier protein [Paenibacillus anaericanus]RUT43008.1 peptide maturation system acyl carrier-related protein [Paenibacillus anaericanus]